MEKFARRPLKEEYPYLVPDARYERVREEDGVVRPRNAPGGDRDQLGGAAVRARFWSWRSGRARRDGRSFWRG